MATNYPGSLDSYTTKNTTDDLALVDHAASHNDLQDAIVAIQTELGIDPAGSDTDVVTRLNNIDTALALLPDISSGAGAPASTPAKVGNT